MKDAYVLQVETYNTNLQGILRTGFAMEREEVFEFLGKNEKSGYEYCIKELKNVFAASAPQSLLRKFNKSFKRDENDKLREWRDVEEAKIKEYFETSKKMVDEIFE